MRFLGAGVRFREMANSPQRHRGFREVTENTFVVTFLCGLLLAGTLTAQTVQQGEALWKQGRYSEANEVFMALSERNPGNAEYHVKLGRLSLDYGYPDQAQVDFDKALAIDKTNAGALLGMAMVSAELYEGKAADLAHKALEADPKLVEAQALLARVALEDNNDNLAAEEAHKALDMDAKNVEAKAVLASLDLLADKKETQWDPHEARGYLTIGHFFFLNRRYDEEIAADRKALELDPSLWPARADLGVSLMRLGRNDEALKELELCYNGGFKNRLVSNTLKLMSTYDRFTTFTTDKTILVLNKKEAELLRPYFQAEMDRNLRDYEAKYKLKLSGPVRVEVYPDHEDFAIRTAGMPGLGALGVTFQRVIAMDSPSGRVPGSFHWAATLRHEMSHVFTLTMTNSHVPRWFTEGIAVHEEGTVSPEWSDRVGPNEIEAIKDHKLLPIDTLDRGFVHPTAPAQVIVSYFQAGKICDFITEKWGWDAILAMLHDYATSVDTPTVIRKELKVEPAEFDKQFMAWLDPQVQKQVQHFSEWREGFKMVNAAVVKKDWDAVLREGPTIRDDYPDYVEGDSMYEALAKAYTAKGNNAAATKELQSYVKNGGRDPETIKSLAKQLIDAGKKEEAAAVLDRINLIFPEDRDMHVLLGGLAMDIGKPQEAIREYHAVLADKPLDPAQAHYDLARAYVGAKQTDKAKDELLAALEIAPGFRPAQKLLLKLSEN